MTSYIFVLLRGYVNCLTYKIYKVADLMFEPASHININYCIQMTVPLTMFGAYRCIKYLLNILFLKRFGDEYFYPVEYFSGMILGVGRKLASVFRQSYGHKNASFIQIQIHLY